MEWISVKDKLPQEYEDCLFIVNDPDQKIRLCGYFQGLPYSEFVENWEFNPFGIERVSYWTPIPDLPND